MTKDIKASIDCLESHITEVLRQMNCMMQTLEHCRDRYGFLLSINGKLDNDLGEAFRAIEKLKKIKRKVKRDHPIH